MKKPAARRAPKADLPVRNKPPKKIAAHLRDEEEPKPAKKKRK